MISLLPLLLHRLHEYGYPVLWLSVFIAAVGVPLPIGLLLLAVGAFAGYGDEEGLSPPQATRFEPVVRRVPALALAC